MRTVPDVLQYDLPTLTQWLGEREAAWLYDRVRGIDHSEVEAEATRRASVATKRSPRTSTTDDELERELLALVTRAAADLRGDGITARTITVRIRDMDFKTRQASRTLDAAVISDRVILEVAQAPAGQAARARRVPARLLGVGAVVARRRRDGRSAHAVRSEKTGSPKPIAIACSREQSIGSARDSATKGSCRPGWSTVGQNVSPLHQ